MTSEGVDGGIYFMSLENVDLRWRRLALPDPTPCARSHHAAASIGSKLYIFGGKDTNGTVLNDLWMIDFGGETPSCVQIAEQYVWPTARYHFASVALPTQSAFVVIGGKSQSEQAPDDLIWIWEHRKQTWQSQPLELSPSRYGHSLTLLSPTKICLIGGSSIADPSAEASKNSSVASFEGFIRSIVLDEEHASAEASSSEEASVRRKRGDSVRGGRDRKNSRAVPRGSVSALVATYSPPVTPGVTPTPTATATLAAPSPSGPTLQRETSASSETTSVTDSTDDHTTDGPSEPDHDMHDIEPAHDELNLEPHHLQIHLNDDRHFEPESPHPPFDPEPVAPITPIQPVQAPIEEFAPIVPIIQAPTAMDISPFDEVPDSPIPPPPEDEPIETSASVNTTAAEPSPASQVEPEASSTQNSVAAPVNPAVAAMKRAGANRMRSARISTGHSGFLQMLVPKPGNLEWIDFMDAEQLRIELKAMTNFVYTVKNAVDNADPSLTAEETLQSVKALYSTDLPKFTAPAIARPPTGPTSPTSALNGDAHSTESSEASAPVTPNSESANSHPSSAKFSITPQSPTSVPIQNFAFDSRSSEEPVAPANHAAATADHISPSTSNESLLTRSAPLPIAVSALPISTFAAASPSSPGSGKLWGATASPGSGRDRDSFLAHRSSMMLGSSGNLPITSTSPPAQDGLLRIGSRGSLSLGNSPTPSPAPEVSMSPSSSSNALSVSQSSHQRGGSDRSGASPSMSPSSSASNLIRTPSTENIANKRSTIVVKEFDLSSTAEKQAAMVESQLDASYSIPTTSCPDTEQSRRDREYAVQELLDTESKYVRDLNLIVEQFQKPLQANNVLNAKQLTEIFSIIKDFIPLHEQLLKELSETVNKPYAEQCPGQIFLAMADYLKMYTGFCASQTNIAQRISDLTKSNSSFRKFLDAKLKDEKLRGLTLTAFLVMPIQRVCRFPLLLKQIAKSTPVSHPDFKKLHLGIFKVDKVVLAVNEGKRTLESQAQMYELEQSLAWDKQKAPANFVFIDPSRRLVLQETHVEWLPASSKEKIEVIHALLFNDILLLARPKEGTTQRKIRRAYALATTNVGIDDSLDNSSGKSTLQVTFGDETINLAFSSKEKRSEVQMAFAEAKQKLPDSTAVRETISALETYHAQH